MADAPFSHLVTGIDSLIVCYYLKEGAYAFDWDELTATREAFRGAKAKFKAIQLGSEEFLLSKTGTSNGYPFKIQNENFVIECGQFNTPNFLVSYPSQAIWHHGISALHARFTAWAESVGFRQAQPETITRVDFAFDYHLPVINFTQEHFVSSATSDNRWRKHKEVQTFTFGKSNKVLRVYNKTAEIAEKSHKTWFYPIWDCFRNVWRIECQFRKDAVREVGIRQIADLMERQGDLVRTLVQEHTTLRVPTADSNASRWPLHPLWEDLQKRVDEMPALGVVREYDEEAYLEERLLNCAMSTYGYLKRIGAIKCLQLDTSIMPIDTAFAHFERLIRKVHDQFTWQQDVKLRVDEMRLGQ